MSTTVSISIREPEDHALMRAAEVIHSGGLIVYPTETLYGIGADARNPLAVGGVQRVKRRADGKPILIVVASAEALIGLVDEVNDVARLLMDAFWPGPLTLVFKASKGVPEGITHGLGTVGVRVPSSAVCLKLLDRCGCPLTSTSANISGQSPSRTITHIRQELGEGIDLYLDAGELPEAKPSTVIDVTSPVPRIVRAGLISNEAIRNIIPELSI